MKKEVLVELTKRWDRDATTPDFQDGSPDAEIQNAIAAGRREGLRECADALRMLMDIME